MYTGLTHLHNTLRWVVLILLVFSVVSFFVKASAGANYTKGDNRNSLLTLISVHLQLLIGWVLFFVSPVVTAALDSDGLMKDKVFRFWAIEHPVAMTLAVILITIGRAKGKRATTDVAKFKTQAIFFAIGLFIILVSIPWPFRMDGIARAWF